MRRVTVLSLLLQSLFPGVGVSQIFVISGVLLDRQMVRHDHGGHSEAGGQDEGRTWRAAKDGGGERDEADLNDFEAVQEVEVDASSSQC